MTLTKYILGYLLSLALTLGAALLVWLSGAQSILSLGSLIAACVTLALLQFIVQVICFLHVGHDKKSEWNSAAFTLTLLVVALIVGGTLWIMHNLSKNAMLQERIDDVVAPQSQRE